MATDVLRPLLVRHKPATLAEEENLSAALAVVARTMSDLREVRDMLREFFQARAKG